CVRRAPSSPLPTPPRPPSCPPPPPARPLLARLPVASKRLISIVPGGGPEQNQVSVTTPFGQARLTSAPASSLPTGVSACLVPSGVQYARLGKVGPIVVSRM